MIDWGCQILVLVQLRHINLVISYLAKENDNQLKAYTSFEPEKHIYQIHIKTYSCHKFVPHQEFRLSFMRASAFILSELHNNKTERRHKRKIMGISRKIKYKGCGTIFFENFRFSFRVISNGKSAILIMLAPYVAQIKCCLWHQDFTSEKY